MQCTAQWTICIKVIMQGKLIAVAYTLRTHWNQFSLGGILNKNRCISVRLVNKEDKKHLILINLENSHNSFLWPEYFIDFLCEWWNDVRLRHPSCVYISAQRQYTAVLKMCTLLKWLSLPYILGPYDNIRRRLTKAKISLKVRVG